MVRREHPTTSAIYLTPPEPHCRACTAAKRRRSFAERVGSKSRTFFSIAVSHGFVYATAMVDLPKYDPLLKPVDTASF